jgi:hypothetical protein
MEQINLLNKTGVSLHTDAKKMPLLPIENPPSPPPSGRLANKQGNLLESTVKDIFISKGFTLKKYKDYLSSDTDIDNLILTNAPYTSIYKHNGKTEFLIKSLHYNLLIRIECKWQQSQGSVDEKLPYLYLNCVESMPEDNIMIVIDGNGFKKGAVEWLKEAASERKFLPSDSTKKIQVFTLTEFLVWANHTFR